jgi:1,4-alpha-glucan branching enzyme
VETNEEVQSHAWVLRVVDRDKQTRFVGRRVRPVKWTLSCNAHSAERWANREDAEKYVRQFMKSVVAERNNIVVVEVVRVEIVERFTVHRRVVDKKASIVEMVGATQLETA